MRSYNTWMSVIAMSFYVAMRGIIPLFCHVTLAWPSYPLCLLSHVCLYAGQLAFDRCPVTVILSLREKAEWNMPTWCGHKSCRSNFRHIAWGNIREDNHSSWLFWSHVSASIVCNVCLSGTSCLRSTEGAFSCTKEHLQSIILQNNEQFYHD